MGFLKFLRNKFLKIKIMEPSKNLVPPKCVQGMKILDRKAFETLVNVPYIEITPMHIGMVNKLIKPYILKMQNLKPIQNMDNSTNKIILLNAEKITSFSDFKEEEQKKLSEIGVPTDNIPMKELTIEYINWKCESILRAIIPPEFPTVSGYSIIGHILHLNLRNHHEEYKNIIGQVFLDKIPTIRTVVNKINIIDSTYRNFQMELLSGDNDTVVKVKEHGSVFEFDFAKVYWNPRLSTEHSRIVEKLKDGDIFFDVFSGVGPFAIPAAKKKCQVHANDLNPDSFKWLCQNVKLNKVDKFVKTYNLDGAQFIKNVIGPLLKEISDTNGTIHIAMNLPAIGVEFLSYFRGLVPSFRARDKIIQVHSYCFIKDMSDLDLAKILVEENIGYKLENENVLEIIHVRNVAPNKDMVRVSFILPKEILETDCNEPPIKKLKV